ncbi:hypothetical protein [Streptosporangium roseum]|uniref:hypothetical protein n=1 Tax=Streptosporangium roseum TaxID=2001 RepID=UPI0033260FD4
MFRRPYRRTPWPPADPAPARLAVAGHAATLVPRHGKARARGHLVRGAPAAYDGDEAAAVVSGKIEEEPAAAGGTIVDPGEVPMP